MLDQALMGGFPFTGKKLRHRQLAGQELICNHTQRGQISRYKRPRVNLMSRIEKIRWFKSVTGKRGLPPPLWEKGGTFRAWRVSLHCNSAAALWEEDSLHCQIPLQCVEEEGGGWVRHNTSWFHCRLPPRWRGPKVACTANTPWFTANTQQPYM